MKFALATVAGAMAGLAAGEVALTNTNYNMAAGSPFTLTWGGASGNGVDILLKSGDSGNLKTVDTLDSGEKGSSFVWTPPSTLCSNLDYAFEIVDGSDTNYSPQFSISGLSACASATSSTSTSSSSTRSTTVSPSKTSADSSSGAVPNNEVSSGSSKASPATLVSNSTVTVSTSSSTMSTDATMAFVLVMLALGWHI